VDARSVAAVRPTGAVAAALLGFDERKPSLKYGSALGMIKRESGQHEARVRNGKAES
jgi:hypothetical protein